MSQKLLFLLFLGLLIRIAFIPAPGFEGDITFWKSWSLAVIDKGPVWTSQNTTYNYPAGFTLILWLMGKIYRLLAGSFNPSQYWLAGNYLFLFVAKLPSILADLGIGLLIYWLSLKIFKSSQTLSLTLSALYLFNPVVIYDGVWWGQVDSFGLLFVFLTFLFLAQKKPLGATVALTTGFLLKMQNIIFLPLLFIYIWRFFSWKELVKALATAFGTFLVLTLPFLWVNNLGRTFTLITQNSDWFPYLSLQAYNPWWLVSHNNWQASDKILTIGITSAKTLGLILFSGSYFLALWLVAKKAIANIELGNLVSAFAFAAFSFFILPTQSHERYIFPALVLAILTIPNLSMEIKKNYRRLVYIIFCLVSFTTLINLNNCLISFYPQNGWPFLTFFSRALITKIIAIFNLLVFVFLSYWIGRKTGRWGITGVVVIIASGIFLTNLPYLVKKEIPLTLLKPMFATQDFGALQIDRNLNSATSPNEWAFLSVDHFFYRRGIATHANSRILFDLDKKFSRIIFDYGIDSSAGPRSSALFIVEGDGQKLFTSPMVKKFDLPRRAEVNIKGVKTLTLITDNASDGNFDDHTDWLEPVLYR